LSTRVSPLLSLLLVWRFFGDQASSFFFDPQADIAHFGIPFLLYEPRASLVGWLFLMIVISPFLQMLTTVFAGNLTLLILYRKRRKNEHLEGTA
jgi:hypothetical protein